VEVAYKKILIFTERGSVAIAYSAGWKVRVLNHGERFCALQTEPESHQPPVQRFTGFSENKTAEGWC